MRGKIDLHDHKMVGLYRRPARRSNKWRTRAPKMPGGQKAIYFMLWRIVDGAVRDCFEQHPDYLTSNGRMSARTSIVKRVTGSLMGYATQVVERRSTHPNDVAAERTETLVMRLGSAARRSGHALWVRAARMRTWAAGQLRRQKFWWEWPR